MQQQQTLASDAYPSSNKGSSWLARVSHRASHLPVGSSSSSRPPLSLRPTPSATSTSAGASPVLPLGTFASSGFADSLEQQLYAVQQRNSLDHEKDQRPAAAASPTETEFQATPIDASFGDRIDQQHSGRTSSDLPIFPTQQRSRSGTVTREDKPLPAQPAHAHEHKDSGMDKYTRQAGDSAYDSDAEADDEFERSVFTSPNVGTHFDEQSDHPSDSEDDQSLLDGEDTPTTQGWADRDGRSPTGKVTQWNEEEVADYIAALSPALKQYGQQFVEEGVNGEALIALGHDELRELGVASVGHRLTILKAVYEQKMRAGVKIEEGDYVPLSAEGEKAEMNATQDDIARIIESLRQRDQRIQSAEAELKAMRDYLERISDENRKLREETLPIMRLVKDQRTPLPDPAGGTIPSPRETDPANRLMEQIQNKGSSLSRKFSTKKLFLNKDGTKQNSPTHPPQTREVRDDGGGHLEASAAAMAASSHLTASMTSQASPNSIHGQQLSPTSPAYSTHPPPSTTARSFPQHNPRAYSTDNDASYANNHYSQASTLNEDSGRSLRQQDRARRQAPTPSPREEATPDAGKDRDNPQVEIFKSFRVSIDDPCRVVLPVALKRYNITDDWRQYALYIVHGDQERCLGLEEKPLLLFKQLDKEGRKPMFMLRRHASPQEGWSNTSGSGAPAHAQEPKVSLSGAKQAYNARVR
ncbi:Protein STE50 [Cercospora beticola]|uniref:Protein STE50 n=1 Tax=Cercospora beticola TaxID=122368 RepID=A0A2G5I4K7_CERBT|nr:Protein STE50 [Cercospora beticola]PIA99423.1 Protein STE50 [Cercospora beticola]CAK1361918.1 unnamed protein product [Cercospora beticola]